MARTKRSYERNAGSRTQDVLLLLALLALTKRSTGGARPTPWAPMGPFPEENTIPQQQQIPPNPLDRSKK